MVIWKPSIYLITGEIRKIDRKVIEIENGKSKMEIDWLSVPWVIEL